MIHWIQKWLSTVVQIAIINTLMTIRNQKSCYRCFIQTLLKVLLCSWFFNTFSKCFKKTEILLNLFWLKRFIVIFNILLYVKKAICMHDIMQDGISFLRDNPWLTANVLHKVLRPTLFYLLENDGLSPFPTLIFSGPPPPILYDKSLTEPCGICPNINKKYC